jgi:hypothetical protein
MEDTAAISATTSSLLADLSRDYGPEVYDRVILKIDNESEPHEIEVALRAVLMEEDEGIRQDLRAVCDMPCASRPAGLDLDSGNDENRKARIETILANDDAFRAANP